MEWAYDRWQLFLKSTYSFHPSNFQWYLCTYFPRNFGPRQDGWMSDNLGIGSIWQLECIVPDQDWQNDLKRYKISPTSIYGFYSTTWKIVKIETRLEFSQCEATSQARPRTVWESEYVTVSLNLFGVKISIRWEPSFGFKFSCVRAPECFWSIHISDWGCDCGTLFYYERWYLFACRRHDGGSKWHDIVLGGLLVIIRDIGDTAVLWMNG